MANVLACIFVMFLFVVVLPLLLTAITITYVTGVVFLFIRRML